MYVNICLRAHTVLLKVLIKQHLGEITRTYIEIRWFSILLKKWKINEMEHAGGVRRGVASICDKSFDLISILGKIDFEPNSYIGTKMILSRNRFSKIDLGQTAPPKMTAMTIGRYLVFGETIDLSRFLSMKSRFPRQTLISISLYN